MTSSIKSKDEKPSASSGADNIAPWWLLPLLLACVLAGMVGYQIAYQPTVTIVPASGNTVEENSGKSLASSSNAETVVLSIEFADGTKQRFEAIPWKESMTVLELMTAAAAEPAGFEYRTVGTEASTFLTSIGGVENGSDDRRFWQYWVNGKHADRSLAVYPLQPGDNVLWRFASED